MLNYNQILERLRESDLEAFDTLYINTRKRLYAYAFSITGNEAVAQDIVQDLFIDLWKDKLFMNIHTGLIGYLVRAVQNRSIVYLKKEQTRQKLKQQFDYLAAGGFTLSDNLDTQEIRQQIEYAIAQLPPMPAKVFRMHYIEKLSYAEIAAQLHISPSTISNHMTRALKSLRENLKKI